MQFQYQTEKLSAARRCLMLPHPDGEAKSISDAFDQCSRAFHNFDLEQLDENAKGWTSAIQESMNTSGIDDPMESGTWLLKAEQLTLEEKYELSSAIDELAHWFHREFWSDEQ